MFLIVIFYFYVLCEMNSKLLKKNSSVEFIACHIFDRIWKIVLGLVLYIHKIYTFVYFFFFLFVIFNL